MLRPRHILFVVLAIVTTRADLPDSEWADAHWPVVECSVRVPDEFNPDDPYVVVTYSNTSDRCPAYEYVPTCDRERIGLGPEISFDRMSTEMVDPDVSFVPKGKIEIPPLMTASVVYRVGDMYKIRPLWSRLVVCPGSQNHVQYRWFEFDRLGRLVSNGVHGGRSYEGMISNAWPDPVFREHIRADIRRYAEMKAKGESMPARIRTSSASRTPTNPVPGLAIVSNMIPYIRLPEAETASVTSEMSNPGSEATHRSRRWIPFVGIAIAALCATGWIVRRQRRSQGSR